ncbi:zinc finger protein 37 isoform X5 [Rhipicephalus sanguineus]|uniref:zinc finger protein 37 isoform X5 n=1 Tax=Rhipicephalus sanguineus TaxID=34632 RepID=UPI0020C527FB|nr:zinc finger protein 37 isoform X5 [Rhipicephalus sanguineus]
MAVGMRFVKRFANRVRSSPGGKALQRWRSRELCVTNTLAIMGRPRIERTPEEQLTYEERRREQRRECSRRYRTRPEVRERDALRKLLARATHKRMPGARERDAQRKRMARADASQREAENAARRRKRRETKQKELRTMLSGPDVLLRRCPCGQVLNTNDTSQLPAWEVRRDVSIQCGLQRMPPLPLPMEIILSTTTGDNAEEGTRLSQVLSPVEKEEDHGTDEALKCERLFRCHLCKYSTPKLQRLRSHLVSHSTEKPFKCEVCPVAFKCLESYNAHMCKHTGEKLYQCDLCPYSTAYKKSHLEHKRTHLNDRPFACTMCEYRTHSKSNLLMHKRQHTNNKPFKCKVCSLGFGRKHSLKIHMQQHLEL